MALAQEDFEQLGDYVKLHIGDWLAEQSLGKPAVVYEIELRHQRELMREGFAQMDKRFEQVDKRFESVQQDIRGLQTRMDHFMRWSFGVTIGSAGIVISVLKFWPS